MCVWLLSSDSFINIPKNTTEIRISKLTVQLLLESLGNSLFRKWFTDIQNQLQRQENWQCVLLYVQNWGNWSGKLQSCHKNYQNKIPLMCSFCMAHAMCDNFIILYNVISDYRARISGQFGRNKFLPAASFLPSLFF